MTNYITLIDDLIQAAYDSGYYSGKGEDGQPHHKTAIAWREKHRRKAIEIHEQFALRTISIIDEVIDEACSDCELFESNCDAVVCEKAFVKSLRNLLSP